MAMQVVATDAALAAIERLTAKHGQLMLVQSGGCCDGSSPICLHAGELLTGPNDLLLGTPGGADFYIDAEQYERWNRPQIRARRRRGRGRRVLARRARGSPFRRALTSGRGASASAKTLTKDQYPRRWRDRRFRPA